VFCIILVFLNEDVYVCYMVDNKCVSRKCFVVSAPSGAGKTTLVNKLLLDKPDVFYDSISDTTRKSRTGEVDGRDYNFIGDLEFESGIEDGKYLEWANVHGNFYGTPSEPMFDAMDDGLYPLMILDVQGYSQMKEKVSSDELCGIFILPPEKKEWIRRILGRGEIDSDDLENRLRNAKREMSVIGEFKYHLRNDDLDVAYSVFRSIIEREMGL